MDVTMDLAQQAGLVLPLAGADRPARQAAVGQPT